MKNLRNLFATMILTVVIALASFNANAGILMTDNAVASQDDAVQTVDGVVVHDIVSAAFFALTGIIVHDEALRADGVVVHD